MASEAITVSASMPTKISSPRKCSNPKLSASALPELGLVRMSTLPLASSWANVVRATSSVLSLEPSSITMTCRLG